MDNSPLTLKVLAEQVEFLTKTSEHDREMLDLAYERIKLLEKEQSILADEGIKEMTYLRNALADVYLSLDQMRAKLMPQIERFEADVLDVIGKPDHRAPERLKSVSITHKTSN